MFQRDKPTRIAGAVAGAAVLLAVIGCTAASPSVHSSNGAGASWSATEDMSEVRDGHTATALPDGTVLVVGGYSGDDEALASAELYDPDSGSWTDAGEMIEARGGHTATVLDDGSVLVAGGRSGDLFGVPLASAELYDPDSGTWTAAGMMLEARDGHTATLLPDGMVLVAGGGGIDFGEVLASAELFDPDSETWSSASPMIVARKSFTATPLSGGVVLVAGGGDSNAIGALASAELYDASNGPGPPPAT